MTSKPQSISLNRLFLFGALLLIGICSSVGLFASSWWVLDLFNHFRPQALLATSLLLILALLTKNKKSSVLALVIITLNFTLMIERFYAFPAVNQPYDVSLMKGKTQNISIIFSNVLTSNANYQSLLDMISGNNPDLIVTTEIDEKWQTALTKISPAYPYSLVLPRSDNFGMAIYSKLPFKNRKYDVGDYQLPLMVLEFDNFTVMAAHPIPPTSADNAKELHAYMNKITEIANQQKQTLILVGDLNATMWSDTMNYLREANFKRTNKLGFAWTWPSGFFPLAIQIDHIFVRGVETGDFQVLPFMGSDHFPIRSNITFVIPSSLDTKPLPPE